jgi:hypothetical protein
VGWSGGVLYGDGDITSFDGAGEDVILMDCAEGQPYSVTFQLDSARGYMIVDILGYNATQPQMQHQLKRDTQMRPLV